jgi:hypothetical protein
MLGAPLFNDGTGAFRHRCEKLPPGNVLRLYTHLEVSRRLFFGEKIMAAGLSPFRHIVISPKANPGLT